MLMLPKNIKRIRKEHKLSQVGMSDLAGIDLKNYQKLESGKYSPSIYTLHKLSICSRAHINQFFL